MLQRVHVGGVPSGKTWRSPEIAALDLNISRILDKTGDTTEGDLHVGAATTLVVGDAADATTLAIASGGRATFAVGARLVVIGTADVGDGTNPAVVKILSGSKLQTDASAIVSIQNGMRIIGPIGTASTDKGRFVLGDSDYPNFAVGHPARTLTRRLPLASVGVQVGTFTGWYEASGFKSEFGVTGPGTSVDALAQIPIGPSMRHSATLSALNLLFTPNVSHLSLPAVNVRATLRKFSVAPGSTAALTDVGAQGTYVPVSLADYTDGTVKSLSIPIASPTIDTATNAYVIKLSDENGAGAISGNVFHALELVWALTDDRPQ